MKVRGQKSAILDKVGACVSTLCAVHCLLTGLAMGFLAVAGLEFLGNPWVEATFILLALTVGVWAMIHGIRRHHSLIPSLVFVAGLASIVASHFVGHDSSSEPWGTVLAVIGGLSIASFHLLNQRLQHRNCSCGKKSDMAEAVK